MAAFKQLNAQDVIISPFEVNKSFTVEQDPSFDDFEYIEKSTALGDNLTPTDLGIRRLYGVNQDPLTDDSSQAFKSIKFSSTYNAVKHLYYGNYVGGKDFNPISASLPQYNIDGTITGSVSSTNYFNYPQTTLEEKKYIDSFEGGHVGVISFPTKMYGDNIKPNSFSYILAPSESFPRTTIVDDGEGRLVSSQGFVGNINYSHGLVTITTTSSFDAGITVYPNYDGTFDFNSASYLISDNIDGATDDFVRYVVTQSNVTCSFSSSYTVYETQYKITINENDYNYTLNPSSHDKVSGDINTLLTGSEFSPYITTVGLYNDNYELLAVGKLAKPLPTSKTTDTTILINLDKV